MRAGLYVHFPFCLRKCLYCDFNSKGSSPDARQGYAGLLLKEMEIRERELLTPVRAATLYFGGGTPSLMEPEQVGELVQAAASRFGLEEGAEVTLEANPGTLTTDRLAGYRAAGVNRISLGIQSFEDRLLAHLGRVHSTAQALDAFNAARSAGFNNISIDLMHSLPGQSPLQWREALSRGIALSPEQISAYPLSVEEGTPFARLLAAGQLPLPDEEEAAQMFEGTAALLREAGYLQYEISNFARPGYSSRHNCAYWSRESYLGFGAGAHSFWNGDGVGERWCNAADLGQYREAILQGTLPLREREILTLEQAVSESFFLGLRVLTGLDLEQLGKRFGEGALASHLKEVARLEGCGVLMRTGSVVRLAPRAVILANSVFSRFL